MIMCEKVIDVQNISKKFGKSSALQDVSFSISKGEIFGFLGPSGSGKTTMIIWILSWFMEKIVNKGVN